MNSGIRPSASNNAPPGSLLKNNLELAYFLKVYANFGGPTDMNASSSSDLSTSLTPPDCPYARILNRLHSRSTSRNKIKYRAAMSENLLSHNQFPSDSLALSLQDSLQLFASEYYSETQELASHLLSKGFADGAFSDITIVAFGQEYHLHKIILAASGYFAKLFGGEWKDSVDSRLELSFDGFPYVTQYGFETVLLGLYGSFVSNLKVDNVLEVIATASYLSVDSMTEACAAALIQQLNAETIGPIMEFVLSSDHGVVSILLRDACYHFVYSAGWELDPEVWLNLTPTKVGEIICSDAFFVPTEYDRCLYLCIILLRFWEYELSQVCGPEHGETGFFDNKSTCSDYDMDELHDQIYNTLLPIYDALAKGIYYYLIPLQYFADLQTLKDPRGSPLIKPSIIQSTVWKQVSLRDKILQASRAEDALKERNSERLQNSVLALGTVNNGDPETQVEDGELVFPLPNNEGNSTPAFPPAVYCIQDDIIEEIKQNDSAWSTLPPCRFSMEFHNLSKLKLDERVYSHSVWYAGSYWSVYIMKGRNSSRSSGYHLRIYLRRDLNGPRKVSEGFAIRRLRAKRQKKLFPKQRPASMNSLGSLSESDNEDSTHEEQLGVVNISPPEIDTDITQIVSEVISDMQGWDIGGNYEGDDASSSGERIGNSLTNFVTRNGSRPNHIIYPDEFENPVSFAESSLSLRSEERVTVSRRRSSQRDPAYAAALAATSNLRHSSSSASQMSNQSFTGLGFSRAKEDQPKELNDPLHDALFSYIDDRSEVIAYYKIFVASPPLPFCSEAVGLELPTKFQKIGMTCFSSKPDSFEKSRGWGWRSDALYFVMEELAARDAPLKVTVNIGYV
ncbi:hypothetical protein CANCADRAFT_71785 [Tortispora caseinolytica NRRL Y-17796]|uniref:BTB domain-containing protein n=1 Tax=Tortispora caseinolytica NRRL Y-17796 TaxID=767744 RepID=A0A1E4TID1_9ASCO|nr:hypothetical protein CANCADRAFT_71785 [Tortispora caseinolytica NRRL Y-17796]